MSLQQLTWRHFRQKFAVPSQDTTTIITAVFNAFKATRYSDNSVRTPGSGVAWTSSTAANGTRVFTPPSPTKTFSVQMDYYRAGVTSSQSTAFGHTLMSYPMMSFTLDGTYSATNVANPVSSGGRWFGWTYFWTGSGVGVNTLIKAIDIFESQDALIICPIRNDGFCHPIVIGGIIDPGFDSDGSLGYSSEIDGKVYGLLWGGDSGIIFNQGYVNHKSFLTNPGSYGNFLGSGTYVKAAIMNPRTATLINLRNLFNVSLDKVQTDTSVSLDTGLGAVAKIPIYASSRNRFIGRYREFYLFKRTRGSQTIYENGQPIGYTVGYYVDNIGSGDTILITR